MEPRKFGPLAPAAPRPRPGDPWRMVEARITMNGKPYHLWRATDADGATLDILVQERRDAPAAERCLRRLVAD